MQEKRLKTILLVEDNEDHVEHALDALNEGGVVSRVKVVHDGQAALDYIAGQAEFAPPTEAPRPNLILLDVKLPKIDGFEVLDHIKSNADLKSIPVIMLTTTGNKEDIERSARLGANDYIVKPLKFDTVAEKIKGLANG